MLRKATDNKYVETKSKHVYRKTHSTDRDVDIHLYTCILISIFTYILVSIPKFFNI